MNLLLQYRYREDGSVDFPGAATVADDDRTFHWTMSREHMAEFKKVSKSPPSWFIFFFFILFSVLYV